MPKYRDVVIEFGDIVNLWCGDNTTAEQHAGLAADSTDEDGFPTYSGAAFKLCVVSWPEHVLSPLYNCDCAISFIDEPEAIRLLSRGEADGRSGLGWKILKHERRHEIVAQLETWIDHCESDPETSEDLIAAAQAVLKEFCSDYTKKELA